MTRASGNETTIRRLAVLLESAGYSTDKVDSDNLDPANFAKTVLESSARLVVAVHAFRAGRLLLQLPDVVRTIIVLGGTDVNEVMVRGSAHAPGVSPSSYKQDVIVAALNRADAIVAFTESLRQGCLEFCEGPGRANALKERVVLIPQAVEVRGENNPVENHPDLRETLGISAGVPLLLLVAGLRPVKRPLYLMPAVVGLRSDPSLANLCMVIVGPVLNEDTAREVALATGSSSFSDALGIDLSVRNSTEAPSVYGGLDGLYYHPPVDREVLLSWMGPGQADIVLNSSDSEGQSNVLLEAAAVGCPRLARACSGNEALIAHGRTGLLFQTVDEAELGIRRLLVPCGGEMNVLPTELGHYRTGLARDLASAAKTQVAEVHSLANEAKQWQALLSRVTSSEG